MKRALDHERRARLSALIQQARDRRGLSQERLAEVAEEQARELSASAEFEVDRKALATVEITRHHIARLENCPAHPLGDPRRRARLAGVAAALGLDLADVNRFSGGL